MKVDHIGVNKQENWLIAWIDLQGVCSVLKDVVNCFKPWMTSAKMFTLKWTFVKLGYNYFIAKLS